MSEIKVLSTTAMKTVFEDLAPAFERATGNRAVVELGPSLRLEKELGEGKAADVAIVSRNGINDLVARGRIAAGSAVHIANSTIGVAVANGAPKPDISTPENFKRAMLAAKSIACSKPVGGGQSGAHLAKILSSSASRPRCRPSPTMARAALRGLPASSCGAAKPRSAFSRWPN